ncbi:MAG: hypothetical protein MUD00_02445 [Candidatus Pacebacteria bacterium]|jgi:putative ABC transport system permease protein|nr:hypothetical protein [Candidatus Paceibacterota bacterium]
MKEYLRNFRTSFLFSLRILSREWKKFVLPFLSLSFTASIVATVLLFSASSADFLQQKNKELIGGDIAIESNYPLFPEDLSHILGDTLALEKSSTQFEFSGIVSRGDTRIPVLLSVVDAAFPVYGGFAIQDGIYKTPEASYIYIDTNAQSKLGVVVGESIVYANETFIVKGIIESDSRSLFSGFRFLPKVVISTDGFARLSLDRTLVRAEYSYFYTLKENTIVEADSLIERARSRGASVAIAGVTDSGFVEGLSLVRQFLVLAVLLTCILSAVNIYAGMLYIVTIMRKSFAILLALGFSKQQLITTLSLSVVFILILATIVGLVSSWGIFSVVQEYVFNTFALELPVVGIFSSFVVTIVILFGISFASCIPSLKNLTGIQPSVLISGQQQHTKRAPFRRVLLTTFVSLVPLALVSIFLLKDALSGLLTIFGIIVLYVLLAIGFYYLIFALYKRRVLFSFFTRTIIAAKYRDGFFGIVSITSLYVALTVLSLLILLQATLTQFIQRDIETGLPSVYVVDIQKSQVAQIQSGFEDITLFPNVGARLLYIDTLDIQKSIAAADDSVSRELGREYNLTYRQELLTNEKVIEGAWLSGIPFEVSVEKEFAERAGIEVGSTVVFSIQGFEITSLVTSIRESDTRSGLPFFYFVFNTQDLEGYPATFFGYSFADQAEREYLTTFLAQNFPNVSIIDTQEVRVFAQGLVGGLTILILVIAIPPLVLALFLIVTLIISSFESRRKQSAQLMVLGAKNRFIEILYLVESLANTLIASIFGYLTALVAVIYIGKYYLRIREVSFYNQDLIYALGAILVSVTILTRLLWNSNKKPLRELLAHEEQ